MVPADGASIETERWRHRPCCSSSVAEALERIRSSPVVHADETGWRENGVNGYVWTFSTSRYFLRRGRGGEVVDEVLGEEFGGMTST